MLFAVAMCFVGVFIIFFKSHCHLFKLSQFDVFMIPKVISIFLQHSFIEDKHMLEVVSNTTFLISSQLNQLNPFSGNQVKIQKLEECLILEYMFMFVYTRLYFLSTRVYLPLNDSEIWFD